MESVQDRILIFKSASHIVREAHNARALVSLLADRTKETKRREWEILRLSAALL